jgi:AcrR family transcriptional regulator
MPLTGLHGIVKVPRMSDSATSMLYEPVPAALRAGRRKPDSLSRLKLAARKLFVERGYDATRPQDIAREAGLGHGTFYLHYPDKRACFLGFVEDAREELDIYLRAHRASGSTLEERIASTLNAIYDYSDNHPGVLRAAMTDETVIDAEGSDGRPLMMQWGREWAEIIRKAEGEGNACSSFDAEIIGQAIAGALHQTSREAHRAGRSRVALVDNLTRFLTRALRPD